MQVITVLTARNTFLRGLVRVDTGTDAGSPNPTLVEALTEKMNSVPRSRLLGVVKLVSRPVLFVVGDCEESVGS